MGAVRGTPWVLALCLLCTVPCAAVQTVQFRFYTRDDDGWASRDDFEFELYSDDTTQVGSVLITGEKKGTNFVNVMVEDSVNVNTLYKAILRHPAGGMDGWRVSHMDIFQNADWRRWFIDGRGAGHSDRFGDWFDDSKWKPWAEAEHFFSPFVVDTPAPPTAMPMTAAPSTPTPPAPAASSSAGVWPAFGRFMACSGGLYTLKCRITSVSQRSFSVGGAAGQTNVVYTVGNDQACARDACSVAGECGVGFVYAVTDQALPECAWQLTVLMKRMAEALSRAVELGDGQHVWDVRVGDYDAVAAYCQSNTMPPNPISDAPSRLNAQSTARYSNRCAPSCMPMQFKPDVTPMPATPIPGTPSPPSAPRWPAFGDVRMCMGTRSTLACRCTGLRPNYYSVRGSADPGVVYSVAGSVACEGYAAAACPGDKCAYGFTYGLTDEVLTECPTELEDSMRRIAEAFGVADKISVGRFVSDAASDDYDVIAQYFSNSAIRYAAGTGPPTRVLAHDLNGDPDACQQCWPIDFGISPSPAPQTLMPATSEPATPVPHSETPQTAAQQIVPAFGAVRTCTDGDYVLTCRCSSLIAGTYAVGDALTGHGIASRRNVNQIAALGTEGACQADGSCPAGECPFEFLYAVTNLTLPECPQELLEPMERIADALYTAEMFRDEMYATTVRIEDINAVRSYIERGTISTVGRGSRHPQTRISAQKMEGIRTCPRCWPLVFGPDPTPAPPTDAPATPAPSTNAPATLAPQTSAPATQPPATDAPMTSIPPTDIPTTSAPRTDGPSTATTTPPTSAPVTDSPKTPVPQTDIPTSPAPQTGDPTTRRPATLSPATGTPVGLQQTQQPAFISSSPPTVLPTTPVPFTSLPSTPSPPTQPPTLTPATSSPTTATPTSPTPATPPPTRVPPTPAPVMPSPRPSTLVPSTSSPPTQAPSSPQPPTPTPATSSPTTATPTSPTPTTPPPTQIPSTPAPVMPSPRPSTLVPSTSSPFASDAPATDVPGASPSTPAATTDVPSTPKPGQASAPPATLLPQPPSTWAPTGVPQTGRPVGGTTASPVGTLLPRTAAPSAGVPSAAPLHIRGADVTRAPGGGPLVPLPMAFEVRTPVPLAGAAKTAAETANTVSSGASATAAVAAVAAGPGPALRLVAIAAVCEPSVPFPSGRYSRVMSPLQWDVANSRALGTVVGNAVLTAAALALGAILSTIADGVMKMRSPRLHRLGAHAALMFPAAPLAVYQMLYQGTSLAGMDLILNPPSPPHAAAGLACVCACIVVPVAVHKQIAAGVPLRAYARDMKNPAGADTTCTARYLLDGGEWVSRLNTQHFARRWMPVLRPYRTTTAWYAAVEFIASFIVSAAQAVNPSNFTGCGHVKICIAVVALALLAMEYSYRPHLHRRNNVFDIMLLMGMIPAMVATSIAYYSGSMDSAWYTIGAYLLLYCLAVLSVRTVVDVIAVAISAWTERQTALQEEAFVEEGEQADAEMLVLGGAGGDGGEAAESSSTDVGDLPLLNSPGGLGPMAQRRLSPAQQQQQQEKSPPLGLTPLTSHMVHSRYTPAVITIDGADAGGDAAGDAWPRALSPRRHSGTHARNTSRTSLLPAVKSVSVGTLVSRGSGGGGGGSGSGGDITAHGPAGGGTPSPMNRRRRGLARVGSRPSTTQLLSPIDAAGSFGPRRASLTSPRGPLPHTPRTPTRGGSGRTPPTFPESRAAPPRSPATPAPPFGGGGKRRTASRIADASSIQLPPLLSEHSL